jgi:uncharacterized protein YyaL (SSP411 family)
MSSKEPNKLVNEQSPYLRQHAYNPVDWYPWSEEAFEKAKSEDKPIFLSIGYSTCHWCHVMERESFTDKRVAELMNDAFINIKVDREERPDIDGVYMSVCQMLTGGGGWPLTIIMTPELMPFYAGTYFPKITRFGRLGMMELIPSINNYWHNNREKIEQLGKEIVENLQAKSLRSSEDLETSTLDAGFKLLNERFDEKHGGFGYAPKFPTPHNLLFLLRYWKRTKNSRALFMVEKTLKAMRRGGIFDQLGKGFHRYSTEEDWHVPHFEKMLYDQAMLLLAYSETFQATGDSFYRDVALEIASYVKRILQKPKGGFYSAEDADSEGVEGKFYVWESEELKNVLQPNEYHYFSEFYGVMEGGNYLDEATKKPTGWNILNQSTDKITEYDYELLRSAEKKLFKVREMRERPSLDDKVLVDWNGLMIAALAYSSRALNSEELGAMAESSMDFILDKMWDGETLLHRYREGETGIPAFIDDYSFTIWALLELYLTFFKSDYLRKAIDLMRRAITLFWDEAGGFYFVAEDTELPARRKDVYDGARPSGNSIMFLNLLRLSRITGNHVYEEMAHKQSKAFSVVVSGTPHGYTMFLCGLDFAIGPSFEVVISGKKGAKDMLNALKSMYLPNIVVVLRDEKIFDIVDYVRDLYPIEGHATAFVCSGFVCENPTTETSRMIMLIND